MPIRIPRRDFLLQAGSAACAAWLAPGGLGLRPADDFAELAAQIPQWMKEAHLPGAAVAIVREGRPVWARSFGLRNVALGASVDDATVFEAASLSKPVFAYAVLSLTAEGKFDLDRPLTAYLPKPYYSRRPKLMASEVPPDPRLDRITPRIVLSHTTGFPNWAQGKPLSFRTDPGAKFGYSGEGYVYLQNVVEHVTGEPLDEFARQRLFVPLGMPSSSFIWRDDYEDKVAIGYTREGAQEKWKGKLPLAAASLHTTAGDFARFLSAILRPPPHGLNEEWLTRMLSPQTQIDEFLSWGLGWGLEKRPRGNAFWQWGDNGEFKAFAIGSREERLALIVLTNNGLGLRVCRKVVEHVLPGLHPALSFGMLDYS